MKGIKILYPSLRRKKGTKVSEINISAFSNNLQELREASSLSLQAFAELCNISSVYTLQNYLYGNSIPPVNLIVKICNVFDVSPNKLFKSVVDFPTEQSTMEIVSHFLEELESVKYKELYAFIKPLLKCISDDLPNIVNANFGSRLRALRMDTNISQKAFAEQCGVEWSTLKLHESEQRYPKTSIFLEYCCKLKVSPEYLLCNDMNISLSFKKLLYSLTPRKLEAIKELKEHLPY